MTGTEIKLKLTPEPITSLKVRTGIQAGTVWNHVVGLKRNNIKTNCPMACPSGWEGTTRNMTREGGDCGCAG